MEKIRIEYYGHSCFKVTYGCDSALFDPYETDSVPGINLPAGIEADLVYCSHEHGDHNAKHLIAEKEPGSDPFKAEFITVPHDEAGGTLRGMNRITVLHAGQARIVHMGDIGRIPTDEEYAKLKGADIVMIPVGGHYTIDASQAAAILSVIQPKLSILMHFRKGNRGYGVIADINDVRKSFSCLEELNESVIEFAESEIPERIITLEPLQ